MYRTINSVQQDYYYTVKIEHEHITCEFIAEKIQSFDPNGYISEPIYDALMYPNRLSDMRATSKRWSIKQFHAYTYCNHL